MADNNSLRDSVNIFYMQLVPQTHPSYEGILLAVDKI